MNYTLQQAIGRGAFGTTFTALTDSGQVVAIKAIDIAASEAAGVSLSDIAREADILKKLSTNGGCGQYVTCYYDGFIANYLGRKHAMLVSEYIDGPSLRQFMRRGVQPPHILWPIMTQLLLGLRFIHQQGFAHRDIKPENILMTRNNTVKYIDFGISCLQKCRRQICVDNCRKGPGTYIYMAPEYYTGRMTNDFEAAKAADVWALAVTMFELVNGSNVFPFITQRGNRALSEDQIKQNITVAPQRSSNYQLDNGQTNQFMTDILINDWRFRPTVDEALQLFIENVVAVLTPVQISLSVPS